jgi:hypothetical protein
MKFLIALLSLTLASSAFADRPIIPECAPFHQSVNADDMLKELVTQYREETFSLLTSQFQKSGITITADMIDWPLQPVLAQEYDSTKIWELETVGDFAYVTVHAPQKDYRFTAAVPPETYCDKSGGKRDCLNVAFEQGAEDTYTDYNSIGEPASANCRASLKVSSGAVWTGNTFFQIQNADFENSESLGKIFVKSIARQVTVPVKQK